MEVDAVIQSRINGFKSDLTNMSISTIVRKHITFGDCYVFENGKYFDLKAEVADHFEIHPSEILLVGSAKLGFSIAPRKRYRPFGDQSDIDIAIVSPPLFEKIWQQVFDYQDNISYFWPRDDEIDFKHFLFTGWIRPDKLPPARSFSFRKEWWDFFLSLTSTGVYGPYKITAGLYKSWYYLEKYQSICVKQCQEDIRGFI
jgi:hypothetical protein